MKSLTTNILKGLITLVALLQLAACDGEQVTAMVEEASTPAVSRAPLSWTAPVERENNAAIAMSEVAGFNVYYGSDVNNIDGVIEITDAYESELNLGAHLATGTWFVKITTVDSEGRESRATDVYQVSV